MKYENIQLTEAKYQVQTEAKKIKIAEWVHWMCQYVKEHQALHIVELGKMKRTMAKKDVQWRR